MTIDQVMTVDKIRVGQLVAKRIQDDLDWAEGAIAPQPLYSGPQDQQALVEAVLASIQQVDDQELAYSSCTDGRIPVRLLSGEAIPVREQMVGADMVSAFLVAEVLGANFYKDPAAPVAERIMEVAAFLHENNVFPSSHLACGAAAGFVSVLKNVEKFTRDERFVARLQQLLPVEVYDEQLLTQVTETIMRNLAANLYDGLDAQMFLDAVEKVSGKRAIAELKDDGRGVHGHVEEQIFRVRVPEHAINEAKVAELTDGREVFGVSDTRLAKLAALFGRGNDVDYRKAYLTLEIFADAGHGTLAKNLPTYIVEVA